MTGLPVPWTGVSEASRGESTLTQRARGTGDGPSSPASTEVLVEQAAAVGVAALRISLVVQMVPALVTGTHLTGRPHLYVLLWCVAVVAAVGGAAVTAVRRRPPPDALVYVDVGLAVVLLVLSAGVVPVEHRIGSWVGWTAGYSLTVACTSGPLRSTRAWLLSLGLVVAGYLVYVGPLARGATLPTVVANALGYVVLAGTVRLIVWYLRRISRVADAAQAEVARLARLEEEHRAQLAMHDATTVMQLLADPTLPPELRAQLQTQAVTEVRRMRTYLRGEAAPAPAGDERTALLRAVVHEACEGFSDLPLEVSTDLLDDLVVERSCAADLVAALRTVLHNVRRHAGASRVVVHGEAALAYSGPLHPAGRRWTVLVGDDGCGFDTAATPLGVGLQSQVVDQLVLHEVETAIWSTPGQGTRVELSGTATG